MILELDEDDEEEEDEGAEEDDLTVASVVLLGDSDVTAVAVDIAVTIGRGDIVVEVTVAVAVDVAFPKGLISILKSTFSILF